MKQALGKLDGWEVGGGGGVIPNKLNTLTRLTVQLNLVGEGRPCGFNEW